MIEFPRHLYEIHGAVTKGGKRAKHKMVEQDDEQQEDGHHQYAV